MTNVAQFPGREYHLRQVGDALPFHPLAAIFPLLEGAELVALKEDILKNGLREPIVVLDGLILDGRNRFLACRGAAYDMGWPDSGVVTPVKFVRYNGTDPVGFVLSLNLRRRHLNESQRAMAAARIATLSYGQRPVGRLAGVPTQQQAAVMVNVGERSVRRAREVLDEGIPELVAAVDRGDIPVSTASMLATAHSETLQRQASSEPNMAAHLAKQAKRNEKEKELATKQAALPDKKYGVIYGDPPWRFEPWSRETGMDRAADNHYLTGAIDALTAIDVGVIAAPDCVLFLWTTTPMLEQAFELMQEWGFAYRSHVVWAKDRIGTGYWFRNKHELLLIGVRGNIPAPAMGTQWPSLIEAPVDKHSAKPECFLEMIEAYFPSLPKIELFRRGPLRHGWDAWGNEAEAAG